MNEKSITGVGVMSGSSLDGLDLSLVTFSQLSNTSRWNYILEKSAVIPFSQEINELLKSAPEMSSEELLGADSIFGRWVGEQVNIFLNHSPTPPEFIASHGHTVFHNPEKGYSFQLGKGEDIFNKTNITVINDFRSMDISFGGQGAPLVPVFDNLVLHEFDACLNLGGISNITINTGERPIAGDICATNQMLNYLSKQLGKDYDKGGELAKSGTFNEELLSDLQNNPFLDKQFPKSLSNEMIQSTDLMTLGNYKIPVQDSLKTLCRFIGIEIKKVLDTYLVKKGKVLITGGGTFNDYLIHEIRSLSQDHEFIIPDKDLINFKEAIAFAFLGALKLNNEINCYSSVTGASRDSICGRIIGK